jgi:hypothetical protein
MGETEEGGGSIRAACSRRIETWYQKLGALIWEILDTWMGVCYFLIMTEMDARIFTKLLPGTLKYNKPEVFLCNFVALEYARIKYAIIYIPEVK